ncbi:hypothetical protein EB118_03125 [bacterium]|nr:hypothetical protein [bacterium]NDC93956.1 hypothetical protein [bacterium]NDD83451.1 hypothetical protein [bacterium]NDG29076.1 hypothetical protein [bacterium]
MADVCAPNVMYDLSCYTHQELVEIAKSYNKYVMKRTRLCHPHSTVCSRITSKVPITDSKASLIVSLQNVLGKVCSSEACWTQLPFIDTLSPGLVEKLRYFTFKPPAPETKYSWLSTTDINSVMQQYAELFVNFKFVGALPSDFYKITKFHFDQISLYHKIGIVFNLDTHDQKGSHWVAFLIDNGLKTIEYFDSAGKPPNKYIDKFIKKVQKVCKGYTVCINTIVHQRKNSECGIYSIHFIIKRLLGFSFKDISSKIISDNEMNKFRDNIFSKDNF